MNIILAVTPEHFGYHGYGSIQNGNKQDGMLPEGCPHFKSIHRYIRQAATAQPLSLMAADIGNWAHEYSWASTNNAVSHLHSLAMSSAPRYRSLVGVTQVKCTTYPNLTGINCYIYGSWSHKLVWYLAGATAVLLQWPQPNITPIPQL